MQILLLCRLFFLKVFLFLFFFFFPPHSQVRESEVGTEKLYYREVFFNRQRGEMGEKGAGGGVLGQCSASANEGVLSKLEGLTKG